MYLNEDITVFESAERKASVNSSDFENMKGRGVKVVIDVTATSDTPSVVFAIQGKDLTSGKYYDLLKSAAITSTGTTILTIYPHIDAETNISINDILPRFWRVTATHEDADAITYSVGACTIL